MGAVLQKKNFLLIKYYKTTRLYYICLDYTQTKRARALIVSSMFRIIIVVVVVVRSGPNLFEQKQNNNSFCCLNTKYVKKIYVDFFFLHKTHIIFSDKSC